MIRRFSAVLLIAASAVNLHAQTVALKGKVTDGSGKAVAGAVVTLLSENLKDTTDAEGAYGINAQLTAIHNLVTQPGSDAIALKNGTATIRLAQPAPVTIEVFDMRGKLLDKIEEKRAPAGMYRCHLGAHRFAGSMIGRVTVGQKRTSFRYIPLGSGLNKMSTSTPVPSGSSIARLQAVIDTLDVVALGYKSKKSPVSSYDETIDIVLESDFTGTCTASKRYNGNFSGSGPHKVVVETNSDPGINEGTIYRPEDLGPGKNYPIFIWGEGACSKNGLSNSAAMSQIASHGYFVIADGTPNGGGKHDMDLGVMTRVGLAYATWIIAENRKPCSAYYQSLDTSKVAANGFSCGGFLGQGFAGDPRTTTWGVTSSGSFGDAPDLWKSVHTTVLILEGSRDISSAGGTGAYDNGKRDYNGITALGKPAYFISNKNMGHGGDLGNRNGGEFTKINLAWLNWWLKGDEGPTGKGVLVGSECTYCTDSNWEIMSANLP